MHFEINVPPGDPALSDLAAKIAPRNINPYGSVDVLTYEGNNTIAIRGWAFDFDQPSAEISVAVYADDVGIGWFPTGIRRTDVNNAFGIGGNHGFAISVPMSDGNHSGVGRSG